MFKCKKILALVLAIVALAAVAVPAWATEGIANGGTGIIQLSDSSSYVNMRNSASTSGAIRARLGHGTTLTVLSSTNGTTVNGSSVWYRVQIVTPAGNTNASSGQTGYVHSYYVGAYSGGGSGGSGGGSTVPSVDQRITYRGVVTASTRLNLRSTPDASSSDNIIGYLPAAASVSYHHITNDPDWYFIITKSGDATYASSAYIKQQGVTLNLPLGGAAVDAGECGRLGLYIYNHEAYKTATLYVRFSNDSGQSIERGPVTLYGYDTGNKSNALFASEVGYTTYQIWAVPNSGAGTYSFDINVRTE